MDAVFNNRYLTTCILQWLVPVERLQGPVRVCRVWRSIIYSPALWKSIYDTFLHYIPSFVYREIDGYPCGWRGYQWFKSIALNDDGHPPAIILGVARMHVPLCLLDTYITCRVDHTMMIYTYANTVEVYRVGDLDEGVSIAQFITPFTTLLLKGCIYPSDSMLLGSPILKSALKKLNGEC